MTNPTSITPLPAHHVSCMVLLSTVILLALTSCSHLTGLPFGSSDNTAVVYALGSREGFSSPLNAALKPVIPALAYSGSSIALTSSHERAIQPLAAAWEKDHKTRYLIVGYTPPGLPEDQARSLSERRALGIRQRLIELGVDGASVHALGLGNDFATTSPTSHVVVIHQQ